MTMTISKLQMAFLASPSDVLKLRYTSSRESSVNPLNATTQSSKTRSLDKLLRPDGMSFQQSIRHHSRHWRPRSLRKERKIRKRHKTPKQVVSALVEEQKQRQKIYSSPQLQHPQSSLAQIRGLRRRPWLFRSNLHQGLQQLWINSEGKARRTMRVRVQIKTSKTMLKMALRISMMPTRTSSWSLTCLESLLAWLTWMRLASRRVCGQAQIETSSTVHLHQIFWVNRLAALASQPSKTLQPLKLLSPL